MAHWLASNLGPCSNPSLQVFGLDLEHGDELELATWEHCHWKASCRQQGRGWAYDMVTFLKRIDLLDDMGGRDCVLEWSAEQAKFWLPTFQDRCEKIAEQEMLRTLRSGKHTFLIHAIPTFDSPRPHSLSLGPLSGRSLNNFLLSAHLLEIEIGRYIRQQREQRYCQACRRSMGSNVLGG